jgi:hypothetical protein
VLGLQPIEDEANVDQRRAEVGLGPLADYLKGMRAMYQSKGPAAGSTVNPSGGGTRRGRLFPDSDYELLAGMEKRSAGIVNAAEPPTDEKEKTAQNRETSSAFQQLAWARSVTGDYAGALEAFQRAIDPLGIAC